jgi:hypothetical protein
LAGSTGRGGTTLAGTGGAGNGAGSRGAMLAGAGSAAATTGGAGSGASGSGGALAALLWSAPHFVQKRMPGWSACPQDLQSSAGGNLVWIADPGGTP